MFYGLSFLSRTCLIFAIAEGMVSQISLIAWFFMEMSTLSFLFMLGLGESKKLSSEIMKLFLIQALTGMVIIGLIFSQTYLVSEKPSYALCLVILLKMGGIPFHSWLMSVGPSLPWDGLYIFLTAMKIIPLTILMSVSSGLSSVLGWGALLVSSISALWVSNLKILMIWSSLYFMGMTLLILQVSNMWMELFYVYMLISGLLPVMFFQKNSTIIKWKSSSGDLWAAALIVFVLMNMSGLPPLPGFYLKLGWMTYASLDFMSFLLFAITSSLSAFLYLSPSLYLLSGNSSSLIKSSSGWDWRMSWGILVFLVTINMISVEYLM